jgi:hypothetical protein
MSFVIIARHPVSTPPTPAPQLSGFSISSSTSQQSTLNSALPSDSPKSFPCVSYAKTGEYPAWSYHAAGRQLPPQKAAATQTKRADPPEAGWLESRQLHKRRAGWASPSPTKEKARHGVRATLLSLLVAGHWPPVTGHIPHSPPIHKPVTPPSPILLPLLSQSTPVRGPTLTPCLSSTRGVRYTSTDALRSARFLHETRTNH